MNERLSVMRVGYVHLDEVYCWVFRRSKDNTAPLIGTSESGEVLHAGYTLDQLRTIAEDAHGNNVTALRVLAQQRIGDLAPELERLEKRCAELRYEVDHWMVAMLNWRR